ncbi:MAG: phosphocholine cytidylyltransferase family protein [Deltaproteobacteria bacterium]
MLGVILASGVGRRLKPLTDTLPKPLIKIGDKCLLEYQINALISQGIRQLIITTGHFYEKIEQFVTDTYPGLKIGFVYNEKYETTNYIYSLWLVKSKIEDDIILLHGDLFFSLEILNLLCNSTFQSTVIIKNDGESMHKDFKASINHELVTKIAVDLTGFNTFNCLPLYKLSNQFYHLWQGKIDEFIQQGKVNCYAEDALNELLPELKLHPLYIYDKLCMEIDTYEDLLMAQKQIP